MRKRVKDSEKGDEIVFVSKIEQGGNGSGDDGGSWD